MITLAPILLMIGLAILARQVARGTTDDAVTREAERLRAALIEGFEQDAVPQNFHSDTDVEPARRSKLVDAIELRLRGARMLQDEDGRDFIGRLEMWLIQAGLRDRWSPERALAVALLIWTIGILAIPLFVLSANLPFIFLLPSVFFVAYPYLKLKTMITARQDEIRREVPFFIQQLHMIVSTGALNLDDAILRVARTSENAGEESILAQEFARAQAEYRVGGIDGEEALRGVSRRTGVVSVDSLVEAIIQGRRMGTDMEKVLAEYGQQARRLWVQDMRAFKAKKEPLITIGVVITMGGAFVILATGMIVNLVRSLSGAI